MSQFGEIDLTYVIESVQARRDSTSQRDLKQCSARAPIPRTEADRFSSPVTQAGVASEHRPESATPLATLLHLETYGCPGALHHERFVDVRWGQ